MSKATAALPALALVLASATAYATPSARLVYSKARGAESCPDEQALRSAVAARVGYDPFFPWAKQTIVAAVVPTAGGFVANLHLVDEQGVDHGTRTLSTTGDCRELVDVAALAIAIAIDPRSLMPHPTASRPETAEIPGAAPAPKPSAWSASEPDVIAAPPPLPAARLLFEGSAGAAASGGVAPSPTVGGALGFAVRSGRVSLGFEGRIDVPARAAAPGRGSVSSWLIVANFVPCVHFGRVFACALGEIGPQIDASEDVPGPRSGSNLWLAAGGRLGVELALQPTLGLRVRSDVVADLQRPTLRLSEQEAWHAPVVATSLGIDAVAHFQ